MDVVATVVADKQPFELMEPGEGALDDPALTAERGAVSGLTPGDLRCDPADSDEAAVLVVVVAAVGCDSVGPAAGTADLAAHRRDTLEQRDQLGHVVAVTARDRPGQRNPGRVYE